MSNLAWTSKHTTFDIKVDPKEINLLWRYHAAFPEITPSLINSIPSAALYETLS